MPELKEIAREFYTQERGRIVGNTRSWSDLSLDEQQTIIEELGYVIEVMEDLWRWDKRNLNTQETAS